MQKNLFYSICLILVLSPMMTNAQLMDVSPETISLWNQQAPLGNGEFTDEDPIITVHRPAKPNGAVVVICPGGGYGYLVKDPEGHLIAKWLNEHGIVGVVLEYRLPNGRKEVPLLDAQQAIRIARSKAKEWGCDSKKIGIMGFSAGGHLASTAATHFDKGNRRSKNPLGKLSCRPDFSILIYPVISMGPMTHNGSRNNLLGPDPDEEMVKLFSNDLQITKKTPPGFLAHALDDDLVPHENSQMFYDALILIKINARYIKLPSGGHGLNGYKGPMWEKWKTECLQWLQEVKMTI